MARHRRACATAPRHSRPCFPRSPKAELHADDQELSEKLSMRRLQRLVSASVLIALSAALSGCGSAGNWDPMDMLDFLDTKKKLPGERKPVFPEGVPGLQPGVPKELYKGSNRDPLQPQQDAVVAPAPPPAAEPKAGKRGAKSRGQPAVSAAAPAQEPAAQDPDAAAPEEDGNIAAAP